MKLFQGTPISARGKKTWIGGLLVLVLLVGCSGSPAANPSPVPNPTQPGLATAQPTAVQTPGLQAAQATATLTAVSSTETPANPAPKWVLLVGGLPRPTDLAEIPDGSGRLVVLQQVGMIRALKKDGTLEAQIYLDIRDRVGSHGIEQGLLGLAFHPKYNENGFFYVNYTDLNGDTVVARFKAAPGSALADPASEKVLLQVKQPYPNHNGGGVVFGPDGYLYLSLGDGGSAGDPQFHAQSLNTYLGKILRLDVDHGDPYAIPPGNPFAKAGGLAEIFEYGLRNPWRFTFDRATGDLYIADVGQDLYEEIDFIPAGSSGGLDFGWNYREGLHAYKGTPPQSLELVDPVWEYGHDQGCSISGAFVYRGTQIPSLQGTYLYGDYCSGKVWGLKRDAAGKWQSQLLFETGLAIGSFGQDQTGELYLLDQGAGRVLHLVMN